MNHNTDPGQYSLFDDDAPKEAESHMHQGFPLEPIAGSQDQPAEVSEAWEDIGSHAPPTPEVIHAEEVLNGIAAEKAEKRLAARVKDHQSTVLRTPGMFSSIDELNPPELTKEEKSRARAASVIARVNFSDEQNAKKQHKHAS
jgi:hypothetical protein